MPILPILTYVLVLLLAYTWMTRGFFPALLHLACTIVGGAIAFAFYEPAAYFLMDIAPRRGIGTMLADGAFGISLGLLFALSVVLARLAVDKLVPKNVVVSDRLNNIGGGVCGLGIGVLTIGMLVISVSHLRFGPALLGFSHLEYSTDSRSRGSIVRSSTMLRPYVDKITATFYERASMGSLRPINDEPLGKWHPGIDEEGAMLRMTFDKKSRTVLRPGDFTVTGRYTLGDVDTGSKLDDFLKRDTLNPSGKAQGAAFLDGEIITRGHIEGYTVRFKSSAKEKGSGAQVVVGNGQVRLLVEKGGTTKTVFPVAVISQGESATPDKYRWRFDANEVFIASVGGASEAEMTFEFAVPHGYTPIAIYVKGVRRVLDGNLAGADRHFTSTTERDNYFAQDFGEGQKLNDRSARRVRIVGDSSRRSRRGELRLRDAGIQTGSTIGFTIAKGQERSLTIRKDESSRGGYFITGGEETFILKTIRESGRGLNRSLRINRFDTPDDVVIVQLNVTRGAVMSLMSTAAQNAPQDEPLRLYEEGGVLYYDAVGYVYEDSQYYKIRYTPADALRGMNDLADKGALPSQSKPGKLRLLFRCSRGSKVVGFGIGDKMLVDWRDTPVTID